MYPSILLAWIWLLLSTTHAFPLTVRSPDYSSRPTSAQFDGDPGILFKRGPGDNNAGGSTTSKPSSSSVTSTPPPAGDSAYPNLAWQPPYIYNQEKEDEISAIRHNDHNIRKARAQARAKASEPKRQKAAGSKKKAGNQPQPNNPDPLPTPNSQPPQAVPPSVQKWRNNVGFYG